LQEDGHVETSTDGARQRRRYGSCSGGWPIATCAPSA